MRTSRALLPILAAGLVSLCSAAALAVPDASSTNSGNGDVYAPNSSSGIATSFTVVIFGDVLPELGIPASQGNSGTVYIANWGDPFCPPASAGCPVTATYNSTSGNTTLVYSGNQGISGAFGSQLRRLHEIRLHPTRVEPWETLVSVA